MTALRLKASMMARCCAMWISMIGRHIVQGTLSKAEWLKRIIANLLDTDASLFDKCYVDCLTNLDHRACMPVKQEIEDQTGQSRSLIAFFYRLSHPRWSKREYVTEVAFSRDFRQCGEDPDLRGPDRLSHGEIRPCDPGRRPRPASRFLRLASAKLMQRRPLANLADLLHRALQTPDPRQTVMELEKC